MPRFYYHIKDGRNDIDLQGTDLPDVEAAQAEAVHFLGALLKDVGGHFWSGEEWTMRVTDSTDLTLFTLAVIGTTSPTLSAR